LGRNEMIVKDFELWHPAGIRISRDLKEVELTSALPGVEASKTDMRTGWIWYRLPPFTDGEVVVAMSLGFNSGLLERVTLTNADVTFGGSWNEWSEEKERLRAASIGAWLRSKGFAAGTYSWGSVWAGFDAKGGSGSASVEYAAQPTVQADGPASGGPTA
jgi:hypothetical protein